LEKRQKKEGGERRIIPPHFGMSTRRKELKVFRESSQRKGARLKGVKKKEVELVKCYA